MHLLYYLISIVYFQPTEHMKKLPLDIIGDSTFGCKFNKQTDNPGKLFTHPKIQAQRLSTL